MSKFKVGDYVYFANCQMEGEVDCINDDGTYDIVWEEGNAGGRCEAVEDDMELGERTDRRRIDEMSEKAFDAATMNVLTLMRKQYPSMTSGDLQTVAMFSKMFKDEYLKDRRYY